MMTLTIPFNTLQRFKCLGISISCCFGDFSWARTQKLLDKLRVKDTHLIFSVRSELRAMAEDLEKQVTDAILDDNLDLALDLYTKVIAADPSKAASLLPSRAQVHIKLQNFTDAIADANKAIELNASSAKAFRCKGVACYKLEEYETAKAAFTAGANLEPSNSDFQNWIMKCDNAIADESQSEEGLSDSRNEEHLNEHKTVFPASSPSSPPQPKPAQNFRHAFYQNTNEAVVEILAKGLRKEQVAVEFGVQLLKVVIECPPHEPYIFQTRLNRKVLTDKCKYTILGTKVEIRLAKAESVNWSSLEFNENEVVVPTPVIAKPTVNTKLDYPSSSKKGHKDWDKLEAQVIKEEKDEKLEGDAALNKLFRDIYRNADEDTRRAMNKSFVESNGTVLSTNWKDVGEKYVEGSPPSGMEMKKWEA